jgi:hypothetical protein
MDGQVEAAGALVTAGAVAHAIDPPTPAPSGKAPPRSCRNCGTALVGAHCHACGQSAHVHRSLAHMAEEAVHGIIHFEGRFWTTLPMLAWKPGELTRAYVMGQRRRFISPVAMFLLTIFLMFFLFGLSGGTPVGFGNSVEAEFGGLAADPAKRAAELARMVADLERDLKAAEADQARANEVGGLEIALAGARAALDQARREAAGEATSEPGWAAAMRAAADTGQLTIDSGSETLDLKARAALNNPQLFAYKMQQKGYKLSFLLVPLSLPWMLLLFAGRRDVHAYDHVVFLLYSISFMSFLAIVAAALSVAGLDHPVALTLLLAVVPLMHLYRQLKGAYLLSRWGAVWRTTLLASLAILTLSVYGVIILMLGVLD